MLSGHAETLLSFLAMRAGSGACEKCAAAHLGVDRYDALKVIRELVLAGRILCASAICSICTERRLVARVHREQPFGSRRPRN
jgi:hypothetical protein